MHEYSDDPDVVARLAAETAWAIKVRRRYVELRPDDATALLTQIEKLERVRDAHKSAAAWWAAESKRIKEWADTTIESVASADNPDRDALQARIAELSTALAELIMTVGRHATTMSMREAAPLSTAIHKATLAWTPKENAVALEVDPEAPSRVVGE